MRDAPDERAVDEPLAVRSNHQRIRRRLVHRRYQDPSCGPDSHEALGIRCATADQTVERLAAPGFVLGVAENHIGAGCGRKRFDGMDNPEGCIGDIGKKYRRLQDTVRAVGQIDRQLPHDLLRQLGDDVGEMARRLPHEARTDVTDAVLRAAIDDNYAALIDSVTPYLSARLLAKGE